MSEEDNRPQEVEVKDFFYKQMRKLRVFQSPQELITRRSSLLAVSNMYGIIYVAGGDNCVKALKVGTIEKLFIEVQGSLQVEEVNFPASSVDVGHPFFHIALSCDEVTLAVCFERDDKCFLGFIDVRAFYSTKSPKKLFSEVPLASGNADIKVRQIAWNPTMTDTIAVLLSDGQIMMVKLKGVVATVDAILQGSATAVSWSPKGKQIVAGQKNGSLVQYTPDVQKKREIPFPSISQNPSQVSDVTWISTYQFGVVYTECDDDDISYLVILNSPKNGPVSFDVFDDVYYGMGEERQACFYLSYLAEWKLALSIYSGAYEVVTVHQTDEGPWVKWIPIDSAQAVLPTTHNSEETYPLGFAVTFAVTKPLEQDDQKFPPAPILLLLTTDGVLCPFYMVSKNPKLVKEICRPPEPMALDGERLATSSTTGAQKPSGGQGTQATSVTLPTSKTPPSVTTHVTKPPTTTSTPVPPSKPSVPPDTTKTPTASTQLGATPPASTPLNTTTLRFGASKTLGGNLAGLSTNPGTTSFSPVSVRSSTKPAQARLFQFAPTQTAPLGQSSSGLSSTLFKPGPLNFLSSAASTQSPARASPEGPRMAKPTEPSSRAPVKTEPVQKAAIPATTKTPDTGLAATVKTQTGTTDNPPPAGRVPTQEGTPAGNKKEDSVPKKLDAKEKPPSKLSPSKQEQLEASFLKHIHDEVEAFNKEMEEARNRYNELKQLDVMLRELNGQVISKKVNSDRKFMGQVKSSVEGLNDDVNRAKTSLLDAFELLEDAKMRDNTSTDPRHLQLLKKRGLDPSSARKMKEIRSTYLHLDNVLREANMALDEQWFKENRQTRTLQSPCLDTIYQAVRQNRSIVQNQSLQLEAMSNRLNSGSPPKNPWDRKEAYSSSGSEVVLSLSERLREQKLSASTKVSDNVSARKKSELRQMLSKRSTVPVRKTTFISDWQSRRSSVGSVEPDSSSEAEEVSEKEEKPALPDTRERQKLSEKQSKSTFPTSSVASDQPKTVTHSTPKFGIGVSDFSFSMGFKPTSSWSNLTEKKPAPSKTVTAKENLTHLTAKEIPVKPSKDAPTTVKVGQVSGLEKPRKDVSPRDAAAAAALARAAVGASKINLGAAIPAKTLVEHKAKDGNKNTTAKDPNADHHAKLIADAAVKDAENKMKNVTQTPPSNTASTFTVRSSTSAAQSSGPPVMVLQPGGTFAIKQPGENPFLPAGKLVPPPGSKTQGLPGKSVLQPGAKTQGIPSVKPLSGVSTPEKGGIFESSGFGFKPSFGTPSFASPPVFGGASTGIGSTAGVFSGGKGFGGTSASSFGDISKNQPVVQSPSREEGAGGGEQDELDKTTKSPLTGQTVSGGGKENVARSLFDKKSLDDDEAAIVPVRGEPEGESKQPAAAVVTAQRQAAIGKSDKDSPASTNVSTGAKSQSPPKTSSPSTTATSKPPMVSFTSPFSTGPFVFSSGDSKPNLGLAQSTTTTYSTPTPQPSPITKETTAPIPRTPTPPITQPTSQPTQRLGALGSGLSLTPPPFSSGFSIGDPNITPLTSAPSFSAPPPLQTSAKPPPTVGVSENETPTKPVSGSTPTTVALDSKTTVTTMTSTLASTTNTPVFRSLESKSPAATTTTGLESQTTSSESVSESNTNSTTTEIDRDATKVSTTQSDPGVQPAEPSSTSSFSFGNGFGGNAATTTSAPFFGTNTLGSTAPSFQATQSQAETPASNVAPVYGNSPFGSQSQNTASSGFGGGLSGLGGQPMEPNRNPFGVNPSSQSSNSGLFGSAAASSNLNPFQNPGAKPAFGSTGFGTSSVNTGVGSTGFGTASVTGSSFGSPPSFGGNPTFGANSTFGTSPSFGAAPTFGAPPSFGSSPSFGGAPTFGSGMGGTTFGGSPSFGNTGGSPSRVFGSGTEAAGMFGNSSSPTFGSLSAQSAMPSFGSLAGGQNAGDMNQGQGFNSMSGSSFSSYR